MERLIRKTTAQQVAEAVELAVLTGEFEHGSRLPPERKLAVMLGVSRLTLREGLNRLVARGVLVAIPGLGTFVSSVELTHSLDLLASQYLIEKVSQKKVELVRHFFETRRFLLSSILPEAAKRATDDQLGWIIDAFIRMAGTAQFHRDLRGAAEMELRAIHIAAEKADLYCLWLMLNSLRDFFRVARNEIVAGSRLDQYERRGNELVELLRRRDAEGIVRYVRSEYEPSDRVQLVELERRLINRRGLDVASSSNRTPIGSAESPLSESEPEPRKNDDAPALPRTDPASWHRWFIEWYHRNFDCNPWDNPDEIPPGPSIDGAGSPGAPSTGSREAGAVPLDEARPDGGRGPAHLTPQPQPIPDECASPGTSKTEEASPSMPASSLRDRTEGASPAQRPMGDDHAPPAQGPVDEHTPPAQSAIDETGPPTPRAAPSSQ